MLKTETHFWLFQYLFCTSTLIYLKKKKKIDVWFTKHSSLLATWKSSLWLKRQYSFKINQCRDKNKMCVWGGIDSRQHRKNKWCAQCLQLMFQYEIKLTFWFVEAGSCSVSYSIRWMCDLSWIQVQSRCFVELFFLKVKSETFNGSDALTSEEPVVCVLFF